MSFGHRVVHSSAPYRRRGNWSGLGRVPSRRAPRKPVYCPYHRIRSCVSISAWILPPPFGRMISCLESAFSRRPHPDPAVRADDRLVRRRAGHRLARHGREFDGEGRGNRGLDEDRRQLRPGHGERVSQSAPSSSRCFARSAPFGFMAAQPRCTSGLWPRRASASGSTARGGLMSTDLAAQNLGTVPVCEGNGFDEAALARWMAAHVELLQRPALGGAVPGWPVQPDIPSFHARTQLRFTPQTVWNAAAGCACGQPQGTRATRTGPGRLSGC